MQIRIYIDTSVVGGYFDKEFKEDTEKLYKWFEENDIAVSYTHLTLPTKA